MSKLMILSSAIMMAGLVNASTYTWGFESYDITDPKGAAYTGNHTAYLLSGVIGQSENGDGTYKLDFGTLSIVASATMDGDNWNYGEFAYDSTRTSDKIESLGPGATGNDYSLLLLDNNSTVLDINGLKGYEGKYFINDATALGMMDGESHQWTQLVYSDAIAQGDWLTAANVPEPTSGLLLILGMAGLALRRRRV